MEKLKRSSVTLESQSEVTISKVLRIFVGLLYSPKHGLYVFRAREDEYSTRFCTAFRKKLLDEIDDVEQVFLWATVATLDGRLRTLAWLADIWTRHKTEWPELTARFKRLNDLKAEVRKHIIKTVSTMGPRFCTDVATLCHT